MYNENCGQKPGMSPSPVLADRSIVYMRVALLSPDFPVQCYGTCSAAVDSHPDAWDPLRSSDEGTGKATS